MESCSPEGGPKSTAAATPQHRDAPAEAPRQAGGALMLIDKEHQLAGRLLGPFASKQHRHVAAKQALSGFAIRLPPRMRATGLKRRSTHKRTH